MKTTILTIAIALSTLFGISTSVSAAGSNNQESTVLIGVSKINQIEVHGNVEVYVSDGTTDQVEVYNSYYSESALVQDDKGVLRISSYNPQKLVVWVTASELSSLSVYDNAEVRSFGKISSVDLDVKLYDHASAKLDMNTYTTTLTLNDFAKAELAGSVSEASVKYDQSSTLNTANLAALHLVKTAKYMAGINDSITELSSL